MKTTNLILVFLFFSMMSCENKNHQPYDYTCKRPADIPTHYDNGEPIPWDCRWNAYYKEGEVIVIRDSLGQPIAIAIHHKKQ